MKAEQPGYFIISFIKKFLYKFKYFVTNIYDLNLKFVFAKYAESNFFYFFPFLLPAINQFICYVYFFFKIDLILYKIFSFYSSPFFFD